MNNDDVSNIQDDIHDLLIKEFWMYSHHQERFERYGYSQSARFARNSLRKIRHLAHARFKQIQEKDKKLQAQKRGKRNSDTDI